MSFVLVVDNIDVTQYVSSNGISCDIRKIYDDENAFVAANGQDIKKSKGFQKYYSISLTNVPLLLKNQLKNKLKKNGLLCEIDTEAGNYYRMTNFSASIISENDYINIWQVKFDLESLSITKTQETTQSFAVRVWPLEGELYKEYKIDGNSLIGNIKISQNSGGLPISGVYASQLSFSLSRMSTEYQAPSTNAKVTISGFAAPDFFITQRSFANSTVTFTCYDRTLFLDKTFDSSSFNTTLTVSVNEIINSIASQIGFAGVQISGFPSSFVSIDFNDVYNKSCREILNLISETAAGFFYCGPDNSLCFAGFGVAPSAFVFSEDKRTEIIEEFAKGPIDSLIAINNSDSNNNQEWTFGQTIDAFTCIKISSKYMTESIATEIFNRVNGKRYSCFNVEKCVTQEIPHLGSLLYDKTIGVGTYYPVFRYNLNLSLTGAYITLGADSITEQEFDYQGYITRQLEGKLEENKNYNGCSINKNGLKCEGTAGKVTMEDGSVYFYGTGQDEKYGFSTESGGLTHYNGIISSNKKASSVEVDTENNTVSITFEDGHTYKYYANVQKNGTIYTVDNEGEEWQ